MSCCRLVIAIECSFHIVGVLYTIPITKREGHIAVYEPDRVEGCEPEWPISLIYPSTLQNNLFIINGPFVITIFGIGPSLLAALLYDRGEYEAAKVWWTVSHFAWSGIIFVLVPLLLYYGIKFSRILKINIVIAETRLGVPRSRFGLSNLNSKSPARYLFIVLQITVFGGSLFAMLAALMMSSWGIFRDQLLSANLGLFSHAYTLAWTCTLPFVMIVKLILMHIQLVRFGKRQHLFSSLYKSMDEGEDSHGTEANPNPATRPPGDDTNIGKEWDMELMVGVESTSFRAPLTTTGRAIPRTCNYRVPSNIIRWSSLEQLLMREYPRFFTSERIAALPAYLTPAAVPNTSLQGPAVPPLSASALMEKTSRPPAYISPAVAHSIAMQGLAVPQLSASAPMEQVATLPAYLSPAVVPRTSLQRPAVPPLSASAHMNTRLVSSQQRQESGTQHSSDVKSSPCIVYGSRQEAFRELGIFRD